MDERLSSEVTSESVNGTDYLEAVNEFLSNPSSFESFRQDVRYKRILEHVTSQGGINYLLHLKQYNREIFDSLHKFWRCDVVGSPELLSNVLPKIQISPSTLRYVKVVSDLQILFENLDSFRVVEFGVGYGGQLLAADSWWSIKQWDLIDLPPVLQLTQKYLEHFVLNLGYRCLSLNQVVVPTAADLVISNYAISEVPRESQMRFLKKVLESTPRGYLTMNSGLPWSNFSPGKLKIQEWLQLIPYNVEVIDESPNASKDNYILVWGHKPGVIQSAFKRPSWLRV